MFEAGDCNSAASYVASDFGISILPQIFPLDAYGLVSARIENIPFSRTIYLAWKTNGPAEALIKKISPHLDSLSSGLS